MKKSRIDSAVREARLRLQTLIELRDRREGGFGVGAFAVATRAPDGQDLVLPIVVALHPNCVSGQTLTMDEFHQLLIEASVEMGAAAVLIGYGKRYALRHLHQPPCISVELPGERKLYNLKGVELVNDLPWNPVMSFNLSAN